MTQKRRPDHRPDDRPHDGGIDGPDDPRGRGQDRGPDEGRATPRLFIPWGPADDGLRGAAGSVPPWVVSYLWPGVSIRLPDGSLYLGGNLPRNQVSLIHVDVANGGDDTVYAEVSVYWTDPSAGFAPPYLHRMPEVGSSTGIDVPAHATVQAPPITLRPGPGTPDHFCLIALVSGVGSSPDGTWNPLADGHYAQHNLDVLEIGVAGSTGFPVHLVNPFDTTAVVEVAIRPAGQEQIRWFARQYRAEPGRLAEDALGLLAVDGRDAPPGPRLRLELGPRERRVCYGLVSAVGLEAGEFTVVEVLTSMRSPQDERGRSPVQGSFGVAVFARG